MKIESLPFTIAFDGDADVESNFIVEKDASDEEIAYFRGRRLVASSMSLKDFDLVGLVIEKEKSQKNETGKNFDTQSTQLFHGTSVKNAPRFHEIRMWHHDAVETVETDSINLVGEFIKFSNWMTNL